MTELELAEAFYPLGRELAFKSALVDKLNPPAGCETVQEKGVKSIGSSGLFAAQLQKNLTPFLQKHLPRDVREQIATLRQLEAKSRTCA
jgi:hypothetical protein